MRLLLGWGGTGLPRDPHGEKWISQSPTMCVLTIAFCGLALCLLVPIFLVIATAALIVAWPIIVVLGGLVFILTRMVRRGYRG